MSTIRAPFPVSQDPHTQGDTSKAEEIAGRILVDSTADMATRNVVATAAYQVCQRWVHDWPRKWKREQCIPATTTESLSATLGAPYVRVFHCHAIVRLGEGGVTFSMNGMKLCDMWPGM